MKKIISRIIKSWKTHNHFCKWEKELGDVTGQRQLTDLY